jgi:hypothetical protein
MDSCTRAADSDPAAASDRSMLDVGATVLA